jgi:protein-S-isoprenylcysteine O-methyltransferase Ste14
VLLLLLLLQFHAEWGALPLLLVLIGSYATALAVNLAAGLQEEDRDLVRHLGAQFAR